MVTFVYDKESQCNQLIFLIILIFYFYFRYWGIKNRNSKQILSLKYLYLSAFTPIESPIKATPEMNSGHYHRPVALLLC